MSQTPILANPFVMLTNPETILAAVERSERLNRLNRQVYRPLDKPLIPRVGAKEIVDFDREIDAAVEEVEEIELEADVVLV